MAAQSPDKPAHDMHEIPEWHHPAWKDEKERHRFEEDMRLHVYQAMDNLESRDIDPEEKAKWRAVIAQLGELATLYKGRGYDVHIH